jgi:hypothetical protein
MFVQTRSAKRAWFLSIFVGVAATGCAVIVGADGYSVDKGSTGTGGSQGSGAAGGRGGATGGTGGTTPPPDSGGKGGTGGGMPPGQDAGRDAPPGTGSGETLCTANMNTCPAGQSCLITIFSPPGLCTVSCETVACDAEHDCVHSMRAADMFPLSCVKKCPAGVTCPTGLLCVPIGTGPVCLPLGWFDGLGIGDDCFADGQCLSGICRNKPGGWCSKACGAADPLCAHDAMNFPNRNNEVNWCVTNAGSLSCVPGCDTGLAQTCALYPGTTCKPVTDVVNTAAMACLP